MNDTERTAGRRGWPDPRRDLPRDVPSSRDSLLNAAVELFGAHGYAATSVQEVVDRAGLTKGAFYHYFDSKIALLVEIHEMFISEFIDVIDRIVGEHPSPREALRFLIEEMVEMVGHHGPGITIFLEERRNIEGPRFERVRQRRADFADRWVDLLRRGEQAGEFRAIEAPKIYAFGIIGMCSWTYSWYRPAFTVAGSGSGQVTGREIGRMFANMVVDGLAVSGADAGGDAL